MKINWLVRVKNKNFWIAIIPAALLLVQAVAAVFGATVDLSELGGKLIAVVDAVFAILVLIGVVNDPTTEGISDSRLAMSYFEPKSRDK